MNVMRGIAKPVLPLERIQALCRTLPVETLRVFGSYLRDDFDASSDIDLLIEYSLDAFVTFLDMANHEQALAALIGHKVDLRTPAELSRYFRNQVMNAALTIYERGS